MLPRAREDRLVVQELPDEVLVYDLNRHKAHCLNRTAALVWGHCDGQTTVADMATLLRKELKHPVDEAVVWLALDRLGRAHLLRERVRPPAGARRLSRREVMRKLALAGALSVLLRELGIHAEQASSLPRRKRAAARGLHGRGPGDPSGAVRRGPRNPSTGR